MRWSRVKKNCERLLNKLNDHARILLKQVSVNAYINIQLIDKHIAKTSIIKNWHDTRYPFKIMTSTLMSEYLIVYLDTTEFVLVLNEIYTSTYISQLIQYSRGFGSYHDFLDGRLLLTRKLLNQRFLLVQLKSITSKVLRSPPWFR
jgi:hypothetical protein